MKRAQTEVALDELYRDHRDAVASVVARRVPPADRDDVVSEVFLSAAPYAARVRFLSPIEQSRWCTTVAVRRCADYWRTRSRRARLAPASDASESFAEGVGAVEEDFDRAFDVAEAAREADELLSRLHPDARKAVWLRVACEENLATVAARIGRTEAATSALTYRSLRRLAPGR